MLPVSDMRQVHEWFLHRGLPLVLTRRVRSRALIERSAPMVSGVGAVIAATMMLAELTDGDPDYGYVLRLGILTLLLIAAPFALYLLHRLGTALGEAGRRSAALLAIWLTYVGFGSIALWAFRFAWVQLGALGTLMSRALPLLMITVVVYFTCELWQLAARLTRQRLWQTIGFLAVVALLFVVTTIRDEVRALREDRAGQDDPAKLLESTPLATESGHQSMRTPLSLAEQVNVVAVMVVSQAIQVVFFTAGLFAFFLALGIVAVPNDVAILWSSEETCQVGEPPCPGTWFGIHVPVPKPSCTFRCSSPYCPACTSPSAPAWTRCTGSGSSSR